MPPFMPFTLGLLGCMSILAFAVYGIDKLKAKKNWWRIPESFLLGVGFCGGAAGALLGMRLFHHKTKHWYFWVINLVGLCWQIAILVYLWGR